MKWPAPERALLLRAGAAVFTGLLLAGAYPPVDIDLLAWCAFVPLILAVRGQSLRRAAGLGALAGSTFWLSTLFWLTRVTFAGWVTICLYCAIYWIPFAWFCSRLFTRRGRYLFPLLAACLWVGLEHLRSQLFTGFAWNTLAVSQVHQLSILQLASWGGAAAIAFVVIFFNAALSVALVRLCTVSHRRARYWQPELWMALLLLLGVRHWGDAQLSVSRPETDCVSVGLIQPNIPQVEKWSSAHEQRIYESLERWTLLAQHAHALDLVIWPETAVPDYVRYNEDLLDFVRSQAGDGAPILVGSMDAEWLESGPLYFNSSFLINARGELLGRYDKRHLVMFGEYVPLRRWMPFMSALTPIGASFTPGQRPGLIALPNKDITMGVLICFEDTVSALSRDLALGGAHFLVTQTNDAWFDPLWGSQQHLQHGVLRSVETGLPTVRCANTGVTGMISKHGRIGDVLTGPDGHTRVGGFSIVDVPCEPIHQATFYTRHGNVFVVLCALPLFLLLLWQLWASKRPGTA